MSVDNVIRSEVPMNRGGKSLTISLIRMVAMCSIVACHYCQYYGSEWAWWLNVGVQIFFIISGYLYGHKNIGEPILWLKKQFIKILVPYYLFLIPALIAYAIWASDILTIKSAISGLFVVDTIKGIRHLWFISSILFCYISTPYLAAIRDYISQMTIYTQIKYVLLLLTLLSIIGALSKGFFPGHICCYISGYFLAVFIQRLGKGIIKPCFWLSLLPCIISNAVYIYIKYVKNMDFRGLEYLTAYSHLFLAISLVLFMMWAFRNIKSLSVLQYSDRYSYEIYIVHQLFILSPFTLLTISPYIVLNILLSLVVIFFSAMFLQKMNVGLQNYIHRE